MHAQCWDVPAGLCVVCMNIYMPCAWLYVVCVALYVVRTALGRYLCITWLGLGVVCVDGSCFVWVVCVCVYLGR